VSNGDERTGFNPPGEPSRARGAVDPRRKPRVRVTPAVIPAPRDGEGFPRATTALLQLVASGDDDRSMTLAPSTADAVAAAGREATLDGAGSALVEGVTSALDLGSAHLYVLDDAEAAPCLRLVAHTGSHAAFTSDAPAVPLNADLPVTRAVRDRTAGFEADPHGLGDSVEGGAPGVGRWRSALGAQAEAVLPLLVRGSAVGALTLAWRAPRAFNAADRRELELLAAAAALVIDPMRSSPPVAVPVPPCGTPPRTLCVDIAGRVTCGPDAFRPALRVAVATADGSDPDRAAFSEVGACADGRTAIAVGVVRTADGSAAARALEAGRLLCGWMGQGLGPVAALGALEAWAARETGLVAGLDAVACIVDTRRCFVTYTTVRHALLALLAGDGRFFCDTASVGTASPAQEHMRVLLPGDRLAVWSADAPGLATVGGAAIVRSVVADAGFPEGESAAERLVGPETGGCEAQAALVVDVVGAGRP
jgi:hypothetical protein